MTVEAEAKVGRRQCESCGGALPSRMHRQRNEKGELVCDSCKSNPQPSGGNWTTTHSSLSVVDSSEMARREAEAITSIVRVRKAKHAASLHEAEMKPGPCTVCDCEQYRWNAKPTGTTDTPPETCRCGHRTSQHQFRQTGMQTFAHDSGDQAIIHHCLSGDTRYLTRDGVRTLAETEGTVQHVLTSADPTDPHGGEWVPAEIRDFGVQRLWAVTLRRNQQTKTIRATAGHRWLVTTGPQRDQHRVVTTEDLRPQHRLPHLRAPQIWSGPDHEAIRMGFVYGDGAIHQRENTTYGSVNLWGPKEALSKYFDEISRSGQGIEKVTEGGVPGLGYSSGMRGYTKTLPPLTAPVSYLRGWLMGYFAADGSCTLSSASITMSSSSLDDLLHVRDVCTLLGIGTYAPTGKERTGYGESPTMVFSMAFSGSDLDSTFFLREDQRAAFEAKSLHHERFGWTVESVEQTDVSETVYCAVVPGTETFVLEDNIWTGNCPICGSGAVVGGSDGTASCEFCHTSFTVQIQPAHPFMPQTVDGTDQVPPGMPGSTPEPSELSAPTDPTVAEEEDGVADDALGDADPNPPSHPNGPGFPPAGKKDKAKGENPFEKKDGEEDGKSENPFAKKDDDEKDKPEDKGKKKNLPPWMKKKTSLSAPLCVDDFEAEYGYTPEMGDPETSFGPGTCSECGREMTVFTLETTASFRTSEGRTLEADDYMARLALENADDRTAVLDSVRVAHTQAAQNEGLTKHQIKASDLQVGDRLDSAGKNRVSKLHTPPSQPETVLAQTKVNGARSPSILRLHVDDNVTVWRRG